MMQDNKYANRLFMYGSYAGYQVPDLARLFKYPS
jgi:hypothetical protein